MGKILEGPPVPSPLESHRFSNLTGTFPAWIRGVPIWFAPLIQYNNIERQPKIMKALAAFGIGNNVFLAKWRKGPTLGIELVLFLPGS